MSSSDQPAAREARLQAALIECLELAEAGRPPDREELAARYPDLVEELAQFLDDRTRLHQLLGGQPLGRPAVHEAQGPLEPTVAAAAPPPIAPGSRIRYFGNYELLEEIARGGMGVVYKARQTNLKRIVALKLILTGQLATSEDVQRFQAEAQAAARLEHPHIVPIFEIGQAEGQHYFSMALIEGESLAQRIARGVLPPREAAQIMCKVAQAIAFAHVEGVIHRDLKPANILLDRSSEPHVTDFGLAKRVAAEQSGISAREPLTATGQILGTPSYMPPEQASGKAGEVGPQADVYALGAVLYCALVGRPPFQAATVLDTLLQVIEQDPVPLRQLNAAIPRDLQTIAMKCLEKDPRQRYATAAELAEDLRRFLNDEPIAARPIKPVERAWRWLRRQQRSVLLTAATAVVTLVMGTLGLVGWLSYRDWRLGYLSLTTDQPPLVAELIDASGQPAALPFTVPTQVPLSVPAGEYELRLTAAGRLGQRYHLSIDRGSPAAPARYAINLEDTLLLPHGRSPVQQVSLSYALLTRRGRADVLLLEQTGIRRPSWPGAGPAWQLDPQQDPRFKDAPGLRWPWHLHAYNPDAAFSAWHPLVDSPADLDLDQVEDIIIAARHQGWIMALSAESGNILWLAVGGTDVTEPLQARAVPSANQPASTVLAPPLAVADIDGDGVADLIAAFATGDRRSAPTRALECLSGRTGDTIWRRELDDAWFQTPGVDLPDEAKWFLDIYGTSSYGGAGAYGIEGIVRRPPTVHLSGTHYPAIFSPLLVRLGGRTQVVLAPGSRLIGIELATGQHAWPPIDLGLPCLRMPQTADLDGDGQPEVVLVQPDPANLGRTRPGWLLSAWSLSRRAKLWEYPLVSALPESRKIGRSTAVYPQLADLDADGRSEVIVCDISSTTLVGPWADLIVLATDARAPSVRWRRPIKTMDPFIEHFAVGPDINGDGVRDVFAASMFGDHGGAESELFVDALSGADGKTLWWANKRVGEQFVSGLAWWHTGPDGWQLLVSTEEERQPSRSSRAAFVFSAATGRLVTSTTEFDELRLADADGDGVAELFLDNRTLSGGQLWALRHSQAEAWRRIGGTWSAAGDLDGDGAADLVSILSDDDDATLAAISGDNGRRLWHTRLASPSCDTVQSLDADLDGDGTADVLIYRSTMQGIFAFAPRRRFPLEAYSGRTGRRLWSVEMPFSSIGGVVFAAASELDGNALPEIVFSTLSDWDYPDSGLASTSRLQHWLAVLDGRTGHFRWRQPLSTAYGVPGKPRFPTHAIAGALVRPLFADLNGDSTLDLLVPAETAADPNKLELRVLNGESGSLLWQRPLATRPGDANAFQNLSTPLAADLDGDGSPEVLILDYITADIPADELADEAADGHPPLQADGVRRARLTVLTSMGQRKWQTTLTVDEDCGRAGSDPVRQALKPRPQVINTPDGRPLICLGLWGWSEPGRIVVFNASGQQLAEHEVMDTAFRPWIHDVDGNGGDDVLVISQGRLLALDPAAKLNVLWERTLPGGDYPRIIGVVPAVRARSPHDAASPAATGMPIVVVQVGHTLYGISGGTGIAIWQWAGPLVHSAAGIAQPIADALLLAQSSGAPPRAAMHFADRLVACVAARPCDPAATHAAVSLDEPPVLQHAAQSLAPATGGADPRLWRRAPWAAGERDLTSDLRKITWALFNSLLLLVLPGWMVLRLIRRRTWGMRTMLTFPLLASVVLATLTLPLPGGLEDMLPAAGGRLVRLTLALSFAPVVVFSLALAGLAIRRRWWRLFALVTVPLVLGGLFAGVSMLAFRHDLLPQERYVISHVEVPLAVGYYLTSWLFVIGYVVVGLTQLAVARFTGRARRAQPGSSDAQS